VRFFLVDEGDGPPVLLLHGFPDTASLWRHQLPALVGAGYRVPAPDLRGRGRSEMLQRVEDYTLRNVVRDVAALLDEDPYHRPQGRWAWLPPSASTTRGRHDHLGERFYV
jgi:pimeloyl-ACP methyl ester carboxylesterase